MIPFTDDELLQPVQNLIDTKISKIIGQDGGAIKLIKIEDAKIFVQLSGACVGCASSGATLKYVVEKELRAMIHPELSVVNVPI